MLRKQSSETDPADWFHTAADRLRSADCLWDADGLTLSGLELLQQAIERYLKGYLIAKGWSLAKTHDLGKLLKEACQHDPTFGQFKKLSVELTRDYFAQHYPGGDWTDIGENYESLRQQAGELVEPIKQSVPWHFP